MHRCNNFCLRYTKDGNRRFCRCGCGVEKTKDMGDTPGFNIQEKDDVVLDPNTKIKHLRLRRTTSKRMTQCSKYLLQSWRANCDIQLLIYDTDPNNPNLEEIRRVTDYVVSYTTKVNQTINQERRTMKSIVELHEGYSENNKQDLSYITKQILNSFQGKRLISRAESMVEILRLPLIICSETIEPINISSLNQVTNKKLPSTGPISEYIIRKQHTELSLLQYFYELKKQRLKKEDTKAIVPHPIGRLILPKFNVTYNNRIETDKEYMKSTLLLHKPWIGNEYEKFFSPNTNIEELFTAFLNSDICPTSVRQRYKIALSNMKKKLNNEDYFDTSIYREVVDINSEYYEPSNDIDEERYYNFLRTKGIGNKIINGHSIYINNEYRWDKIHCIVSINFIWPLLSFLIYTLIIHCCIEGKQR